jgi:hypothetical protein
MSANIKKRQQIALQQIAAPSSYQRSRQLCRERTRRCKIQYFSLSHLIHATYRELHDALHTRRALKMHVVVAPSALLGMLCELECALCLRLLVIFQFDPDGFMHARIVLVQKG